MTTKPRSAEMYPGPGFRILRTIQRPPADLIRRLGEYPTADISDRMNRLYTMGADIRNRINGETVVGPACTVKVYPGDNLMVHKALDLAQPGDVIVVDTSMNRNTAVIGDLVAQKAKHRGIAAFIIDGLIRDSAEMRTVDLPVFAIGVTPIGPLHRGPGEINYPVSCGGVVVQPGDIVVGDADGVVVVRRDFAPEILDRLDEQREALAAYVAAVRRGEFSNDWVDAALDAAQCRSER